MKLLIFFTLLFWLISCDEENPTTYQKADKGNLSFTITGSQYLKFESDYIDWFQIDSLHLPIYQISASMEKGDTTFVFKYTPENIEGDLTFFDILVNGKRVEKYVRVLEPIDTKPSLVGFRDSAFTASGNLKLDFISKSSSGDNTKQVNLTNGRYTIKRNG